MLGPAPGRPGRRSGPAARARDEAAIAEADARLRHRATYLRGAESHTRVLAVRAKRSVEQTGAFGRALALGREHDGFANAVIERTSTPTSVPLPTQLPLPTSGPEYGLMMDTVRAAQRQYETEHGVTMRGTTRALCDGYMRHLTGKPAANTGLLAWRARAKAEVSVSERAARREAVRKEAAEAAVAAREAAYKPLEGARERVRADRAGGILDRVLQTGELGGLKFDPRHLPSSVVQRLTLRRAKTHDIAEFVEGLVAEWATEWAAEVAVAARHAVEKDLDDRLRRMHPVLFAMNIRALQRKCEDLGLSAETPGTRGTARRHLLVERIAEVEAEEMLGSFRPVKRPWTRIIRTGTAHAAEGGEPGGGDRVDWAGAGWEEGGDVEGAGGGDGAEAAVPWATPAGEAPARRTVRRDVPADEATPPDVLALAASMSLSEARKALSELGADTRTPLDAGRARLVVLCGRILEERRRAGAADG